MFRLTPLIYFAAPTSISYTDLTEDVLTRDGINVFTGRTQVGPNYVVPEPGTLVFTLNNSSTNSAGLPGYYSPYHTACRPGFGLRSPVFMTLQGASGGVTLFRGRITDIVVETGRKNSRGVRVTVGDAFANLGETPIGALSVQVNQLSHQLIDTLIASLDDPDFTSGVLQLNSGSASYPGTSLFATAFDSIDSERTTALEELNRITMSERGRIYATRDAAQAVGRHYIDYGNPAVQTVFNETMVELSLRASSDDLVQTVTATIHPTKFGPTSDYVIYSLGTTSTLVQPGEINTSLFGPYRDSAVENGSAAQIGGVDFETVTATTDYTMNAQEDGLGTNLTASFTVSASTTSRGVAWTITNNSTTAGYITKLQLRGRPVFRTDTSVTATTGSRSRTTYGTRVVEFDMPYQTDVATAQEVVGELAALFSSPGQPVAGSLRFNASASNAMSDLIFLDQGQRIAITETQSGLSKTEYLIVGMKHDIREGGLVFVTLYLEAVTMVGWTTPAFSAGSYTANTGTWTVGSGDVTTYRYTLTNRTMTLGFALGTTTVSGGPLYLQVAIPESRISNVTLLVPCVCIDNGTTRAAYMLVNEGATNILVARLDGSAWSAATNTTYVYGEITFETTT